VIRLAALLVLLLGPLAWAGPGDRSTLKRGESPVIVEGKALKPVLGKGKESLRLYAWREGAAVAIPYQIDERTPAGAFAFPEGDERRSDTDDGRFDNNDELVFMARDVGDRAPPQAFALGQSQTTELVVRDPKGRGWVYLLHFAKAPPPRAKRRYVDLDRRGPRLVGWTGDRVQVVTGGAPAHFLDLRQLRFARARGGFGPDLLDRAKLDLRLGYLFLDVRRRTDEVRAEWTSYRAGPVRITAAYLLECYLIWGHWIRSTKRCSLTVYGNRMELEAEVSLPVALEVNRKSELRMSLDFAPSAGPVQIWSRRNPKPIKADGRGKDPRLSGLKTSRCEWVAASTGLGGVLARLHLDPALQKRRHKLFLLDGPAPDPPEDARGSHGNCGFVVDLSGATAGNYNLRVTLHFAQDLKPGGERALLEVEDQPLSCEPTTLSSGSR